MDLRRFGNGPADYAKSILALALIGLVFVVASEMAKRLDPT